MPEAVFLEGDCIELLPIEAEEIEFLQEGMNLPAVRPSGAPITQQTGNGTCKTALISSPTRTSSIS